MCSTTTSTPFFAVRLRTSATTSCAWWSMVASAPSSRARASLASLPAVAITRAPITFAIWMAAMPTPLPAAHTSTSSPRASRARVTSIRHAVRKTSGKAAASSKAMASGIGITLAAGQRTSSAYPPWTCAPRIR